MKKINTNYTKLEPKVTLKKVIINKKQPIAETVTIKNEVVNNETEKVGVFSAIRTLGNTESKNRKELAIKVLDFLKSKNVTKTKSGHELKLDDVTRQIHMILYHIKKDDMKVFKNFKVIENEKEFKIVSK